ncbi:hypothetical protein MTP99_005807 [Tenebrio molitor]|nr:hypothetical protein MTP99_005807 [Tenebrio molitor]
MRALCSVLPNVRGATANKRRVMAMATQSIILYGAPIWYPAMNIGRHRERVISTQRIVALRTYCAYRTVSTDAALLIAGLVPLHLLARERKRR